MTNGPDEPPWSEPTAEEQAEYARREAAADNRYHHVPARDPAERAEYDRQEAAEAAAEAAEERFIHFYGFHVQDPTWNTATAWTPARMTHPSRHRNEPNAGPTLRPGKPSTRRKWEAET